MHRLATLAAAAALVGSADAADVGAFEVHTDPLGDVRGAPDILRVKVANDVVARALDFRVEYADPGDERGTIWLDTDVDVATGVPGRGSDYRITWDAFRYELERWNRATAAFEIVTPEAMAGVFARSSARSSAVFSVPEEDLGTPRALAFWVDLARGGVTDVAPDAGSWRYAADTARLRLSLARVPVAAPRAGKRFALAAVVMRSDLGERLVGGRVSCAAVVGAARLRGTPATEPRCTWTIPRKARGRILRATIRVAFGGASASKTVRLRIR